jgi:Uma2 family endonuclease
MTVATQQRIFTVPEYRRMIDSGILQPDERVQLIGGAIIPMAPMRPRHAVIVDVLDDILHRSSHSGTVVRCQLPVALDETSEPEPDLVVAVPRPDRYRQNHPRPHEVLLIIEVADSTYALDREVKLPRYAQAGVPAYWIVDAEHSRVEVHERPLGDTYAEMRIHTTGTLAGPAGITVPIADLFG